MAELRTKSRLLTAYLEMLLKYHYPKINDLANGLASSGHSYVDIITPSDPDQRGAQLSVVLSDPINKVYNELIKRGVVVRVLQLFLLR